MIIDFSRPEDAEKRVEKVIQKPVEETSDVEIHFRDQNVVEDLYNAAVVLEKQFNWIQNVGILNKAGEKERFLEAWENNSDYEPDFNFGKFGYNEETCYLVIDACKNAVKRIDQSILDQHGAETITVKQFQKMWKEVFREFELYVKLAANIEDFETWRETCLEIWPMNEKLVQRSIEKLQGDFEASVESKTLSAETVKEMWEAEIERLGIEYSVEVRKVPGCYNIPEEQTVVVAKGREDVRKYSESEAKILTMHEIFHVIRSYNGMKASMAKGLPPFLGIRTPFYDQTEEGGAVYREMSTDVITDAKQFDYNLRAVAAHYVNEDLDFMDAARRMIELGGTPERAFELLSRNREILRHHIYLGGVHEWRTAENRDAMLIGKVNSEYAELFWQEAQANGMIAEPPVKAEDVFKFRFD